MKNLLERIQITKKNEKEINLVKSYIEDSDYDAALELLKDLNSKGKLSIKEEYENIEVRNIEERLKNENLKSKDIIQNDDNENEEDSEDEKDDAEVNEEDDEEEDNLYPEELIDKGLEYTYMSLLLANPKAISMYYILYEDNYFESKELLNLYKSVLFTEGEAYAPQIAKDGYNFAKENAHTYNQKKILKQNGKNIKENFENVYVKLLKLFQIRKNYLMVPIQETKDRIVDILNYKLYEQMTIQEVKDAIEQITITQQFKRGVLSNNTTNFLIEGESNLSNRS